MSEENYTRIFHKGVWKAIIFAVVLLVIGELFLAWQYNRLEKGRLPEIEQKLEEQSIAIEERAAQGILKEFLNARIAGEETKAMRLFTEVAMQQKVEGEFDLSGAFVDYKIRNVDRLDANSFRFRVDVVGEDDMIQQIELIRVKEIGGIYYIDSVQLAG